MFAPPPGGAFVKMKFPDLIPAKFLRRLNRFVAEVSIEGKRVFAHIRNTGRLTELLKPGNTVFLKEKHSGKYPFELPLVDMGSSLVCIDSTITPKLYAEFLSMPVRFEPKFGEHRFDLMYDSRVVETKSVNLVEDGVALFPDAPTERGRKHIQKLIKFMRKQSSAIRVAYNMLKELEKEKTRNPHAQIYHRLRRLFPDLPTKYIDSAIYKARQYPTNKPVVFGGKRLFEKLCKNHLTGKAREKLKKQWRELRQGTLISIGSKSDKGNRLMRFEDLNGQLCLRITTGNREFIYAKSLDESFQGICPL